MTTVSVGAHVVQPHVGHGLLGVRLEEDCLPVPAPRAGVVLGPGHGGVLNTIRSHSTSRASLHHLDNVRVDVGDLVDLVSDPVDVNAAGVGNLTEVAVPGGERSGLRD